MYCDMEEWIELAIEALERKFDLDKPIYIPEGRRFKIQIGDTVKEVEHVEPDKNNSLAIYFGDVAYKYVTELSATESALFYSKLLNYLNPDI